MPHLWVALHVWKRIDRSCPDVCLQEDLHELSRGLAGKPRFQLAFHLIAVLQHISRIIAFESIYSDQFGNFPEGHHGNDHVSVARFVNTHGSAHTGMPNAGRTPLRL